MVIINEQNNKKSFNIYFWYGKKAKQMSYIKHLKKEVEIGANGTQKYVIKEGVNKGKVLWLQ